MNDRPDLDRVITGWLLTDIPRQAPQSVLPLVLERVAVAGQEHPVGRRRFHAWIGGSPRLRLMIVLAVLMAALAAAAVGGQALLRPSTVRMLPDVLPDDVPHGTIDTPLGTARWVHLSGDPTTLPDPLQPAVGPSGLVWFDWGDSGRMSCQRWTAGDDGTPPRLWTSADAVSARVEHPLPVPAATAELALVGDTYWLTTEGPTSLWRSHDLESWDPLDVSGLASPGPAGLEWLVSLGTPVSSHGVSLVPVTYLPHDLGALVGFPGRCVSLDPEGPGRYTVTENLGKSQGGPRQVGTVLVARTPTGIRFSGPDGSPIADLAGVGPDFVDTWIPRGLAEHQLGIVEGSTLTALADPGIPIIDASGGSTTLYPVDGGFLAFPIGVDRTVRAWRSADGRSWTAGDLLEAPDGRPMQAGWVGADWTWGRHEVTVDAPQGWRSTDGVTWTALPPAPDGEDGLVFQFPTGSLRLADDGSWSASLDGTSWVDVPALRGVIAKWVPDGAGGTGGSVIGDTLFFSVDEAEGTRQRDLWIVEVEPDAWR